MNILPALQYHLNQTTPHKWETRSPHNIQTTIIKNTHIITIITIEHAQTENTLHINKITDNATNTTPHTIDLLDPDFLDKIHQIITSSQPTNSPNTNRNTPHTTTTPP